MKKLRRSAAALAVLAVLVLCPGCQPAPEGQAATLLAMNTVMNLTIYGSQGEQPLEAAQDLLLELDGLLSTTDEGSQVYALNHGQRVELDPQVQELLEQALALCADTGGALDLTIYPVVRAWGFTTGTYQVPGPEELAALLDKVDYTQVAPEGDWLALPQGVELDFGAVAKGYAGDQVAQLLRAAGVDCAQLDLGGSIQVLGDSPDGDPWRIGIRDPQGDGPEDYAAVVEVSDQAVVTSGMYERYFEQDGVRYGHIIDPSTGCPVDNGLASVTVVSPSGTLADALSTALFVMGKERAADYWRGRDDFEFVLIGEDGSIAISQGLADCFSLAGDQGSLSFEVIRR